MRGEEMSYVTKRKRVIVVKRNKLDLGTYYLRDWLQPDCYTIAKELIDEVMDKWIALGSQQADVIKNVGLGNALIKLAWNIVNTKVRYRSDTDLFDQADFWMTPAETWSMKFGDCEDTSFLLASTVLRLFDVVSDFRFSWWFRWFNRDAPNCQVWLGFVYQGGQYWGHAWVTFRNPKYQFSKDWLVLETTFEDEVPMNLWIVWNKDIYIPVYCFNKYDSWRIDRDYAKLGLTQDYVVKYKPLIDAMVGYVESGVKMKEKWVHKTVRAVKAEFKRVVNRCWIR
jgi:hypothetical protein